MHAQRAGDHIDVLDVETGQLIVDLHQYISKAAEVSVCLNVTYIEFDPNCCFNYF